MHITSVIHPEKCKCTFPTLCPSYDVVSMLIVLSSCNLMYPPSVQFQVPRIRSYPSHWAFGDVGSLLSISCDRCTRVRMLMKAPAFSLIKLPTLKDLWRQSESLNILITRFCETCFVLVKHLFI